MAGENNSLIPIELDQNKTVKKSNVLNELRNANASLVEYRLFCVYLAHLPMNSTDNLVTFTLADYARIAGLKRPKKDDLEEQSDNLLDMKAKIYHPNGGWKKMNMFSYFDLFLQDGQWMVSIKCTDDIAPMIREQKGQFLRYKLYNTIFLKSYNQQRLYELLKQYEKIGTRTIPLKDLREYLSIGEKEYPVWGVFSRDVLKKCQQSIKENTDICFDFEPIRGAKRGKPVVAVKFTISKNKDFVDRLQIEQHLPDAGESGEYDGEELHKRAPDPDTDEMSGQTSLFEDDSNVPNAVIAAVLPKKFNAAQVEEIKILMESKIYYNPDGPLERDTYIAKRLKGPMAALETRKAESAMLGPVKSEFHYLKGIIANMPVEQPPEPDPEPTSDDKYLDAETVASIRREFDLNSP